MESEYQTVAALRRMLCLVERAIAIADERDLTVVAARLSGVSDTLEHQLAALEVPPSV